MLTRLAAIAVVGCLIVDTASWRFGWEMLTERAVKIGSNQDLLAVCLCVGAS
jgi:hypothetical protein